MRKTKKPFLVLFAICLLAVMAFTTAYGYIYYQYGYYTASIRVKNSSSYSTVYTNSCNAWYNTPTPAQFITDSASSNVVTDASYADTWYGMYSCKATNSAGKATLFSITLNRSMVGSQSNNFKQSVMVHEMGHALSLADNPPQSPSIMRYDRDRNTLITPQQDDINGVNYAY